MFIRPICIIKLYFSASARQSTLSTILELRIMERAWGERKRPKIWQIPVFSRYQSACSSPSKNGPERRKLSLRSENITITDAAKTTTTTTTTTPQSSSSLLFRQSTALAQKQPGKENESPFGPHDHGEKFSAAMMTKSTVKRRKPSIPSYVTNSEKKVIKRRLSGDYEDQLSIEPIDFISKRTDADFDKRHVVRTRFSIYDDGEGGSASPSSRPEVIAEKDSKENVERSKERATAKPESRGAGTPRSGIAVPRDLYFLWKSYHCRYKSSISELVEEKSKSPESSAPAQETSGVEFLIERVDRNDARSLAMNNCRRVKSGSDIGRLKVPLRRGEDISPLKKRINQFKRSGIIVGKSFAIEKKARRIEPTVLATRDGPGKITSSEKVVEKFRPGEKNHLFPTADAKKPECEVGSDRESSRLIESKIFGISQYEILPFEIRYVTDYSKESFDLERAREERDYKISRKFLREKSVTPEQRRIVVNFLISVHAYLLTSSSTLHQATKIFDAILDIKVVSVKELQLVALAASWIAIKNMETKVPSASEMISFAKDMYNINGPKLLCKCEKKILKTLGFNIRFADPFYISAYYLQGCSSSQTAVSNELSLIKIVRHSTGYLLDVALLDENHSGMPSELLAAAATRTAVHLVLNTAWKGLKENSSSYTQAEIDHVAGRLIEGVLRSVDKDSPTGAVYQKYKSTRYDNVSDYLVMKIKKLPGVTLAEQD